MCQCYQTGGPFIAEDPECPAHGENRPRFREEDFEAWARVHCAHEEPSVRTLARMAWEAAVESVVDRL